MSTPASLGTIWRDAIKQTAWRVNRHTPGPKPNICLFATRRGGSTWLMDILSVNRGLRYLNQPFSFFSGPAYLLDYLPVVEASQFIHLEPSDEKQVRAYLEALLEGRLAVNAPWEFWKPAYDFHSDRLLLKVLDAKGLIDWIDQTFTVDILYLTRHPIPTSLSILSNGWGLTAKAYLQHPYFCETYLSDALEAYCWDLLRRGTPLQQYVLNWALENLIPLRLLPGRPAWQHVSYEELTLHPGQTLERLGKTLQLDDMDRMQAQLGSASRSSKSLKTTLEANDDGHARLQKWKKRVSDEEEKAACAILDKLELDLYTYGSVLPSGTTR